MIYLIHKVSKIFDVQNIYKIRLWLVKSDFIVNQTNCQSPAPPHSFIRLFLLTSSFLSLSCHLFLFQTVFYLPTLTFSFILFFFYFSFTVSSLPILSFFLSCPLPFIFFLTLSNSRFLANLFFLPFLFLTFFYLSLGFSLSCSSSLSLLSSLSRHNIFSFSLCCALYLSLNLNPIGKMK